MSYQNGGSGVETIGSDLSAMLAINKLVGNSLDLRSLNLTNIANNGNNNGSNNSNNINIESYWSELIGDAGKKASAIRTAMSAASNGYNPNNHNVQGMNGTQQTQDYKDQNALNLLRLNSAKSVEESVTNSSSGTPPSAADSSVGSLRFTYNGSPDSKKVMNSASEPGSPSLDEAIMMGYQNSRHQKEREKIQDLTLSDIMSSLNLSNENKNPSIQALLHNSQNPMSVMNSSLNSTIGNTSGNLSGYPGLDMSRLTGIQNNQSNSSWRDSCNVDHSSSYSTFSNSSCSSQFYPNNSVNGSGFSGPTSIVSRNKLANNSAEIISHLDRNQALNNFLNIQDPYCIEKAAKVHRTSASVCEATCTWSGPLPVRFHKNPFYSCKVFLGGVPWDVTELALRQAFLHFGNIQVEWPGKENSSNPPKGYVYILFENERQVKFLLSACNQDFGSGGNYYYKISSRRMRQKEVQVIPWVMSDGNYVQCPSYQLDPHKTVFVGALHGMLSAEALAKIINDLFGGVVYAGIDMDKHKYPIGSGRITFNNQQSYRKAVRAAFVEIKTPKFTKKVQIDPYLADSLCQMCGMQQGPYFCRNEACFKYFCRTCWLLNPSHRNHTSVHKPLMRNSKLRTQTRLNSIF